MKWSTGWPPCCRGYCKTVAGKLALAVGAMIEGQGVQAAFLQPRLLEPGLDAPFGHRVTTDQGPVESHIIEANSRILR